MSGFLETFRHSWISVKIAFSGLILVDGGNMKKSKKILETQPFNSLKK